MATGGRGVARGRRDEEEDEEEEEPIGRVDI